MTVGLLSELREGSPSEAQEDNVARFYDEYYRDGAYTERQRRHMEHWHGKKKARLEAA